VGLCKIVNGPGKSFDPDTNERRFSELIAAVLSQCQGCNHGLKVEGDQVGPNTGALASRAQPNSGLGVGCGRGSPPPAVRVRGYHPREILENSDAKSCILVTTCCEISFENYGQEVGGGGTNTLHCWSPTWKLGDQSPPVPTVVAPMSIALQ